MNQVHNLDPQNHWQGLSLVVTDHTGITALHADQFGVKQSTDVISFAYPPAPPAFDGATGEVIVNVEQAVEQGPRYEGPERELALYIAHGCHHLTGAEDHTPVLKKAMRRVETQWLNEAEQLGLIAPLQCTPCEARS